TQLLVDPVGTQAISEESPDEVHPREAANALLVTEKYIFVARTKDEVDKKVYERMSHMPEHTPKKQPRKKTLGQQRRAPRTRQTPARSAEELSAEWTAFMNSPQVRKTIADWYARIPPEHRKL